MKKIFALVLALVLALSIAAFAEEQPVDIESIYEGTWVTFEDDGFNMYIPSDWVELELDQELIESSGFYYAVASADGACTFQLAWLPIEAEMDIAALQAEIASVYPEAAVVALNGFDAVCYADAEVGILTFAVLDQADLGVYYFNFTPASNEEMVVLASLMMASISPVEAE